MSYDFKYADLLDDDVFKLVFGRESTKDVMIEFLNQVIPDRKIIDLEFIDKEMHPVERDAKGIRKGHSTTQRFRFSVRWKPELTAMTSCRSMLSIS